MRTRLAATVMLVLTSTALFPRPARSQASATGGPQIVATGTGEATVTPDRAAGGLRIRAEAATIGPTGVEMEALTAASVAALTAYDMVKGVERGVEIRSVHLVSKSGGQSGEWHRPAERPGEAAARPVHRPGERVAGRIRKKG